MIVALIRQAIFPQPSIKTLLHKTRDIQRQIQEPPRKRQYQTMVLL